MDNLVRYDNDGVEIIINTSTGESFATVSGYARMAGKHRTAISKRITRDKIEVKTAQIPTTTGLKECSLLNEDYIAENLPKDNPEMATKIMKLGVRGFLHAMAGFKVSSTAVEPKHKVPQTYAEALLEAGRLALENERLEAQKQLLESQNKQLNHKIEVDKPKVEYAEAVQFSETSVDFNSYAKMINTGRTRLFRRMREAGIIMQHTTIPYQVWCDAGYFEVSQEVLTNGKLQPYALVTGKGQLWLKQRLDEYGKKQQDNCQLDLLSNIEPVL